MGCSCARQKSVRRALPVRIISPRPMEEGGASPTASHLRQCIGRGRPSRGRARRRG
uniref:Uncharacterized protein n=1 Tax=Anguilla anguilla TaxID=7936 RepID=A0A0E9U8R8_ANGAN